MIPERKPTYRPQRLSLIQAPSLRYSFSSLLSQSGSPLSSTLKPLAQARKPILRYVARLSLDTVLSRSQLSLLPRYSSESEALAVNLSTDFQPRKTWVATESELDAFGKMTKPRKARNSVILQRPPSLLIRDTPVPEQPPVPVFTRSESLEACKRSTQPRKRYINLPKLPFGQHLDYNEETDIRNKIVSKRWKAWKRETKPLPKVPTEF